MSIDTAIQAISSFQGTSLAKSLARIESSVVGLDASRLRNLCDELKIDGDLMKSAASIKKLASQINVVIHAAGILCSLHAILEPDEIVESVSLGAGNTGRQFDLETNIRIAEYKFIDWQGGPESIRQNGIFMDFYSLAEHRTSKSKYLYVVGTDHPIRFLSGRRALKSILSHYPAVLGNLRGKYGDEVSRVCDYYELTKTEVKICDTGKDFHSLATR